VKQASRNVCRRFTSATWPSTSNVFKGRIPRALCLPPPLKSTSTMPLQWVQKRLTTLGVPRFPPACFLRLETAWPARASSPPPRHGLAPSPLECLPAFVRSPLLEGKTARSGAGQGPAQGRPLGLGRCSPPLAGPSHRLNPRHNPVSRAASYIIHPFVQPPQHSLSYSSTAWSAEHADSCVAAAGRTTAPPHPLTCEPSEAKGR
jgi:hypothetical protein